MKIYKHFTIFFIFIIACSKYEQPQIHKLLLGEWHPVFENVDSLHLAHYPPIFTFMPYEQLAIDSIYYFAEDGLGSSSGYENIPSGYVLWSVRDSSIYLEPLCDLLDPLHNCYDSFWGMHGAVSIRKITENEIWLEFYYTNKSRCYWIDLSDLERSRIWKYKKVKK